MADDGKAKFEDFDDTGYQGILSLTYQISKNMLIGLVYRTESSLELDGTVKVEGTAIPIQNRDLKIEWDNPQTLEMGIQNRMNNGKTLFVNLGWQDWSTFSENKLSVSNTGHGIVTDRNWDDSWHAGIAFAKKLDAGKHYSLGLAYESSPVKDKYRTFDLPVDEMWKLSAAYSWQGANKFDFAIGSTLTQVGDAAIDQSAQRVRAAGEFDNNLILAISGTMRYVF